jgi:excisionase family DNA binding protein
MSTDVAVRRWGGVSAAASALGVSTTTLGRMIDSGRLSYKRIPGSKARQVDMNEIEALARQAVHQRSDSK